MSFIPFLKPFAFWICLAVTLVAGREVLKEGFEDLLHFHFGEETLMSIAVVAAFLIGEYVEGTMVALLFTFGENHCVAAGDGGKQQSTGLLLLDYSSPLPCAIKKQTHKCVSVFLVREGGLEPPRPE